MFRLSSLLFALSATTLAVNAKQHNVTVGGPGILAYEPEYVVADPGDTVLFVFHEKNHTLTQSTFANPCTPLSGGFDSGFKAVAAEHANGPFSGAEITVTTADPVWAFCRQSTHCQQGMVFAINPGKKFEAFKANAMGGTSIGSSTVSSSTTVSSSSVVKSSSSAASKSQTHIPSSTTLTVEATTFTLDLPTTSVPDSVITFSFGDIFPSASSATHSALPTAISSSTDHWVTVGANSQPSFNPTNITANVGDTITFEIRPKNHTVTASSFAAPCTPLSETNASASEIFDSGFIAVTTGNFPTYTIQVNTTEPLWIFSAQFGECAQGMVFAVNAPNDDYAVFESKAVATNGGELATNGKNAASPRTSLGTGALSGSLAVCALLSFLTLS